MNCQEIRSLVDAHVDRELDLVTAPQFERHLSECSACRLFCEQYERVQRSVRAKIPYFAAPAGLEGRVRAQLKLSHRPSDQVARKQMFPGWRSWAVAAAAAALLVFSVLLIQATKRLSPPEMLAREVVSGHIRSLMANHLSDVVSSDQHTVKPWFSGKLDFAPVVVDLSSRGFPLAGGRLDYLDNHPVAALVYKRRQHTINLFLWPSATADSGVSKIVVKGYNVIHWTKANMTYWAVSDLNAAELTEFASDLQR